MAKSKTKSSKNILVIVTIVVLSLIIAYLLLRDVSLEESTSNTFDESVKVAFIGPMTEETSSIRNGIALAQKDSGMEDLQVLYENSECNITQASNALNKLISDNDRAVNKVTKTKLVAVISALCTEATMALATIAEENKIILLPISTSPQITSAGEFTFRTVPSDFAQGTAAGNILFTKGYSNLAILFENKEQEVNYQEAVKNSFGGYIVSSENFAELRAKLTKIKGSNADALFVIGKTFDSLDIIFDQTRKINFQKPIFASEGLKTPEIAQLSSADGLNIIQLSSGTNDFKDKYRSEFGVEPGKFSAQSYDALAIIIAAVKNEGTDGEKIKNNLYSMQFSGVSGKIDFDYNGDVSGNYEIYILANKKFEQVQ